jgi:ADP-ribose pyrophosphatase YjhB (NUDIX family)
MSVFPICNRHTDIKGNVFIVEYHQADSFDELSSERIKQSYAVTMCGNKLVIVHNAKKNRWSHVGGGIEKGETKESALLREIQEESNMRVLKFAPVGYQKVHPESKPEEYFYQLRYVAIAEPYGPFISDPAGSIDRIALIDYCDCKKYFDWGEIGDAILKRASEVAKTLM